MKRSVLLAGALLLFGTTAVCADTAAPDPLAGLRSGKKSFEAACGRCHKIDIALAKRLDRQGWEQILGAMTARGGSFQPAERALIVDYLVAKSTFENTCSKCHGVENALAAKRDRAAWEATAKRMAAKATPPLNAEDLKLIVAYLTLVVGSE